MRWNKVSRGMNSSRYLTMILRLLVLYLSQHSHNADAQDSPSDAQPIEVTCGGSLSAGRTCSLGTNIVYIEEGRVGYYLDVHYTQEPFIFVLKLEQPMDAQKNLIETRDLTLKKAADDCVKTENFTDGEATIKDHDGGDIQLFKSESCPTGYALLTIKFSDSSNSSPKSSNFSSLGLGLGLGIGFLVVIIFVCIVVMRRRSWHRLSPIISRGSKDSDFNPKDLSDLEVGGPHAFTYKELSSATHNFDSKYVVGEGGFGTVYQGTLRDTGYRVAIKRLSQYARQGAREFIAEVKIISQLRHRNLVQLLGWCDDNNELILVYEYMPNGDLDEMIYADKPKCDLSWKQRYNILCGVATALVYLHEEWEQRVVHRDVKTSNVMLDSTLNARLGDFGLARLSAHSQAPQSTLVAGTLGYLAPEFSLSGKATDKTDVYAFGVVALEVTCARRPLSPDLVLVDWVWDHHKNETLLNAVDPKLDPRSTEEERQMQKVLQIGLLCAHPDMNVRPSMRLVRNILTGEADLPRVPRSKPVASYFQEDDD